MTTNPMQRARADGGMPRLLIATTVPATLRAFLLPFGRHFREQGWRVDAITQDVPIPAECTEAFDRIWKMQWSRNPLDVRNVLHAPRTIREVVEREAYDLVHVHTPVASFVTRYALRGAHNSGSPKVIYTAHGFYFYQGGPPVRNAVFASLEKLAGRWTDYLIVMNREDEQAAIRNHIVPADRLLYMPGIGLDTDYYRPDAVAAGEVLQLREELGLSPDESLFVMIAEFIPRKRHEDALRALARLDRPELHLALAGQGPLLEPMQRLASDLGLRGRVHFLGYRRDVPVLVRAAVAVVLPSALEGLPRCVMESLSLSVPAIGANIRGVSDLLSEGSGLLVTLGDVEGLAGAMAWIADHPEEARAMGRQGREQIVTNHGLPHVLTLHAELYAKALGGGA